MGFFWNFIRILLIVVQVADGLAPVYNAKSATDKDVQVETALPTVTVHGFSNFRTTVDGTVIVFTPSTNAASEPSVVAHKKTEEVLEQNDNGLNAASLVGAAEEDDVIAPHLTGVSPSSNEIVSREPSPPIIQSSFSSDSAPAKANVLTQSTSKTPKLSDTSKSEAESLNAYPTGLVTVLGGTQINTGVTTVFETKVIGTYINGNYAQILQSTSKIFSPESKPIKVTKTTTSITPSKPAVVRQLTTSAAQLPKDGKSAKNGQRQRKINSQDDDDDQDVTSSNRVYTSFQGPPTGNEVTKQKSPVTKNSNERSRPSRNKNVHPSTNAIIEPSKSRTIPRNITRRRFNRPDRFRFRNTPRPKNKLVQLNRFKVRPTIRAHKVSKSEANTIADTIQKTIPIDPARVVWETSVVTKEVTLHLGRRKTVRTLTVTTTVPVTLESKPSDSPFDDMYASPAANNHLAATAPPFGNFPDSQQGTPSLRMLTRTFSETEVSASTALVPVFDGVNTTMHTVTESYFIRKMITAYRTMPPGEVYITDNGFVQDHHNHNNHHDDEDTSPDTPPLFAEAQLQSYHIPSNSLGIRGPQPVLQTSGLDRLNPNKGQDFLSQLGGLQNNNGGLAQLNPLLTLGAALSTNPLAAAYLGLNLGLGPQLYSTSTITKSSYYVTTDTIYATKVLRIYNGKRTILRTLSEPLSTTERTVTTYETEHIPYLNTQALQEQQKQLQRLIAPSLPPQYSTVTSTYTTVTEVTKYNSKVYRLVYNAFSTKFRTVTVSSTYETTVTATTTSKIPIQQTAFPLLG